jgi:hypothetical protein
MRKSFKITKKTQQDLGGAFDIYDAEVGQGNWKEELWDIDETSTLTINGTEGAAMFLGCAFGELMQCNEAMSDYFDATEYGRAYRMHTRITKVMEEVLEHYKDEVVSDYYGSWRVK